VNKEELRSNDWTFKADFGDTAAMEWQKQMADLITKIEDSLPKRHLIAQNYTNFRAPIPEVNANISIINFHYAWPEAARWNYHFDKVIGFDESGFAGSGDQVYRRQAWQFLFSGGALFNNLDYSFYVGQESGLGENDAPGGGSKLLRNQLHILSDYLHNLSLEKFNPNYSVIFSSPGLIPYALSDGEKYWCIFLRSVGTDSSRLRLNTGNGNYTVKSMNTITGKFNDPREITASNGRLEIDIQIPEGELVLSVIKN